MAQIEMLKKQQSDPFQLNLKILDKWKRNQTKKPVTWDTLIEALQEMDEKRLAKQLKKKFGRKP